MSIFRQWLRPPKPASSAVAKERLKLVLVHNRLEMSGETIENLRREMLAVLACYFEVDQDSLVFDVQRGKRGNQLVTSIAVKSKKIRRRRQT